MSSGKVLRKIFLFIKDSGVQIQGKDMGAFLFFEHFIERR